MPARFLDIDLLQSVDTLALIHLKEEAQKVYRAAYQPYSKYCVGAAVLTDKGNIYTGINMENAAYEGGPHGETSALSDMVKHGERTPTVLVCYGTLEGGEPRIVPPCGGCRQKINEFASLSGHDTIVVLEVEGKLVGCPISELLPFSFGPADIGVDLKKYKR